MKISNLNRNYYYLLKYDIFKTAIDDNDDEIILNSTTRKQIYVMITNGYDNNNNTNSFNNFKRLIDRTASMHLYNTFLIISK